MPAISSWLDIADSFETGYLKTFKYKQKGYVITFRYLALGF